MTVPPSPPGTNPVPPHPPAPAPAPAPPPVEWDDLYDGTPPFVAGAARDPHRPIEQHGFRALPATDPVIADEARIAREHRRTPLTRRQRRTIAREERRDAPSPIWLVLGLIGLLVIALIFVNWFDPDFNPLDSWISW